MIYFINKLYNDGIVTDTGVNEYIGKLNAQDGFIKNILNLCGLTRKVIAWDRESLKRWKSWDFSDEMILEAAKLSAGKSNPTAYMNGILSTWKSEGTFTPDKIQSLPVKAATTDTTISRAEIERHYHNLRHAAEDAAEKALNRALSDDIYGKIYRDLNELSIQLAFAELRNPNAADELTKRIGGLEIQGDKRLKELGIDKTNFTPRYSCKICNDTGYDQNGKPCTCMKKFIASLK